MTSAWRPRLCEHLIHGWIDDDFAVYDRVEDQTTFLNITAAAVFELCDGTRSLEQIVAELASVFDAEREQIAAGVDQALRDFSRWGFLRDGLPGPRLDSRMVQR